MESGKTLIMSLKLLLMSTCVLSIAILLSITMPNLLSSATSDLPSFFSTLRSWLRPPYLYFIINAIILSIVASSRLHHQSPSSPHPHPHPHPQTQPLHHLHSHHQHDVISIHADQFSPYAVVSHVEEAVVENVVGDNIIYSSGFEHKDENNDVVSFRDVEVVGTRFNVGETENLKRVVVDDDDKIMDVVLKEMNDESTVVDRSTWTPPPRSSPLIRQQPFEKALSEKPPVSSRFAHHHRRPVKATTAEGGKALRVSKPKKHDTLESTWKAITEGRHIPLTRYLKKSDTWEHHDRQIDLLDDSSPFPTAVKKSETFHERTNYVSPPVTSVTKLKKEPSLSQDELNRRVEAFINKFNEEMRLQRQQSMQQFMEMINRAA